MMFMKKALRRTTSANVKTAVISFPLYGRVGLISLMS